MRNHRIYHGERPASALMSHAQAYRFMHQRSVFVPKGDVLTVRDRRTGRIVATAIGTGYHVTDGRCRCCPTPVVESE